MLWKDHFGNSLQHYSQEKTLETSLMSTQEWTH